MVARLLDKQGEKCVRCGKKTLNKLEERYTCGPCQAALHAAREQTKECPKDRSEMEKQVYAGRLVFDVCPDCEGLWLEPGELEAYQQMIKKAPDAQDWLTAHIHGRSPGPMVKGIAGASAEASSKTQPLEAKRSEGFSRKKVPCDRCLEKKRTKKFEGNQVCPECLMKLKAGREGTLKCPDDGSIMEKEIQDAVIVDRCRECSGVWLDGHELYMIARQTKGRKGFRMGFLWAIVGSGTIGGS